MAEFFHMGGYAVFVWSSYGATAGLMILLVVMAARRHKKALDDVKRRAKHELTK